MDPTSHSAEVPEVEVRWPVGQEEWVMRSDGTEVVKVAADKSDGLVVSVVGVPTWSPDGKSIAYNRTNWPYVNARHKFHRGERMAEGKCSDPLFR